MPSALETVLVPGGPIARLMGDDFEVRPQQARMIEAVERAMASRDSLLVEAGTGVGKSFAYLVPAIKRIIEHNEVVVVATNTIALQEQLLSKDIPLLREAFKREDGKEPFKAELVKGRGNYLSLRRLKMASERQDKLFPDEATLRSLHVIEEWAYATTDGTLSTLPQLERPGVWDRAQSDAGNCMGRKCPTYEKCFYQQARRRMEKANLLICNHAMFFSDLALRAQETGFLPKYQHVILDEAHNVEDVASEHFGVALSEGRVRFLLTTLVHPGRRKGFLGSLLVESGEQPLLERAMRTTMEASRAAEEFFDQLVELTGRRPGMVRIAGPGTIANQISPAFKELALSLKRLKDVALYEEDKFELSAYSMRAAAIAEQAELLCAQGVPGCVYWVETTKHETHGLRANFVSSA
ncbi:MAG TPA: DEAD/DEAH box helicase, partial [Phycisphaerales bacterium]|nr:DEAD/DEAH box helicase [Phycisphaerales bacterium]